MIDVLYKRIELQESERLTGESTDPVTGRYPEPALPPRRTARELEGRGRYQLGDGLHQVPRRILPLLTNVEHGQSVVETKLIGARCSFQGVRS